MTGVLGSSLDALFGGGGGGGGRGGRGGRGGGGPPPEVPARKAFLGLKLTDNFPYRLEAADNVKVVDDRGQALQLPTPM